MLESECVVGSIVICDYPGKFYGRYGHIAHIIRDSYYKNIKEYTVTDVNGMLIGALENDYVWECLDSWNLYQPPANRAKFAANQERSQECPCGITRTDCTYHK